VFAWSAQMTVRSPARADCEAGCGTGRRCCVTRGAGWLVGVDLSPECSTPGLGQGATLTGIRRWWDVRALPLVDRAFDMSGVCRLGARYHLPDLGAKQYELGRVDGHWGAGDRQDFHPDAECGGAQPTSARRKNGLRGRASCPFRYGAPAPRARAA